jgi:oxaloacetate decarboxylase alpha subunit
VAAPDLADTSISSMSMTYGHSATESVVAILQDTPRATGLDLGLIEEIAAYFREVRAQYAAFEGSLRGVDSRILVAQVPGGMLTNMENQLREQGAAERLDEVLEEIPRVREDLGFIPLVTPTSQIVGTQAVLNVLMGERYQTITKETAGLLRGEYGATAAPVKRELQLRVLEGDDPITCRPGDLLEPEMVQLTEELTEIANEKHLDLSDELTDDVLIYALFPQVGLKFLENRGHLDRFEPHPADAALVKVGQPPATAPGSDLVAVQEVYRVVVNGTAYEVEVGPTDAPLSVRPAAAAATTKPTTPASDDTPLPAPLAGNIYKVNVREGQKINAGDVVVVMEAMKMETEVRAPASGTVTQVAVKPGDAVQVGDILLSFG